MLLRLFSPPHVMPTPHRKRGRLPDVELTFTPKQQFNNTIEFRFKGATEGILKDELWRPSVLARRKRLIEGG